MRRRTSRATPPAAFADVAVEHKSSSETGLRHPTEQGPDGGCHGACSHPCDSERASHDEQNGAACVVIEMPHPNPGTPDRHRVGLLPHHGGGRGLEFPDSQVTPQQDAADDRHEKLGDESGHGHRHRGGSGQGARHDM